MIRKCALNHDKAKPYIFYQALGLFVKCIMEVSLFFIVKTYFYVRLALPNFEKKKAIFFNIMNV